MGVVDFNFYSTVYMGTDATEASFPTLNARASDVIGSLTRWAVDETLITRYPERVQTLYKKAICAQIDFFALNGLDFVNESEGGGFTVGKVTIHAKANSNGTGAMAASVSPLAISYLEQTGLMSPQVPTIEGWW